MAGDNSEFENSIMGLRDLIGTYLRCSYSKGIKTIALESGLGRYLPDQLQVWGNSDFNYRQDVLQFLMDIIENEELQFLQIFFQNIIDSIKKFRICLRFKRGCQIPKESNWSDKQCLTCSKFIDNRLMMIFNRYLKVIGLTIDDEGFVQIGEGSSMDLTEEIKKLRSIPSTEIVGEILSDDLIERGKKMSGVYNYLYYVENSLRQFLENTFIKEIGDDYRAKITIPTPVKKKIKKRMDNEKINRWLPLRGSSLFFYIDFNELGSIIANNWEIFKNYFPSQDFIIPKIKELSEYRNFIAHNSYIEDEHQEVIRTYYHQILRQMCPKQ